jgi:hypothetical protein
VKRDINCEVLKSVPISLMMLESMAPYGDLFRTQCFHYIKTKFPHISLRSKNMNDRIVHGAGQLIKYRAEPVNLV